MSTPRVVAGTARGHRLQDVPGDSTRPITDRAKESLFNIIRPDLKGAAFLDLFAGTGAVGIEALSQGAGFARFIDNQRAAIAVIRANLEATKLIGTADVLQSDSFGHINAPADRVFEYVFIAPPQYKGLWLKALQALDAKPAWLAEDAWVIVQMNPTEYQDLTLENLDEFDQRRYGNVLLVFYERKPDPATAE
jgi:16S rRNA (guanine966-N2)-methyltransferase